MTTRTPGQTAFGESLLTYINDSPTAFHAVAQAERLLTSQGYVRIDENKRWSLKPGGRYFFCRDGAAMIAFEIGTEDLAENGFRVIGAHTDSPQFKIKPGGCIVTEDGYVKCNIENYGGTILSSWFDRPLSMAGRVLLDGGNRPDTEKLIDIKKPVLIIPNLCIHFHRDVNEKNTINKQTDILPLLGLAGEGKEDDYIPHILAEHLQINRDDIRDYDIFLYEYEKGILTGLHDELISASRLDDLAMVYTGLCALLESRTSNRHKVFAAFNHEEVGSTTPSGANASFLRDCLIRIAKCLGQDDEGCMMALANSLAVSADGAHAVHPNYGDKHDPKNRPVLGGGPVIKYSAAKRYATSATTAAFFLRACKQAGVPCQSFVNRSDVTGGSTIGPYISSIASLPTVDVGTPILAMHSVRELACVMDHVYTLDAFRMFYSL